MTSPGAVPFLLECAKQGKTGRFEVLSTDRVQPPAEVAERLKVSPHTKSVLRRENVFYADDDPVHRVTTYIPWSIAKGTGLLQEEMPHPYGIHGVLEDQHHTMTRIRDAANIRMRTVRGFSIPAWLPRLPSLRSASWLIRSPQSAKRSKGTRRVWTRKPVLYWALRVYWLLSELQRRS